MKKQIIILLAILVFGGAIWGGYVWWQKGGLVGGKTPAFLLVEKSSYKEETGEAATFDIYVKTGMKKVLVGSDEQNCSLGREVPDDMAEIPGVICYWAGVGSEYKIFEEEGNVIVKKRVINEGAVDENGEVVGEVAGEYKTVYSLEN